MKSLYILELLTYLFVQSTVQSYKTKSAYPLNVCTLNRDFVKVANKLKIGKIPNTLYVNVKYPIVPKAWKGLRNPQNDILWVVLEN